MQPAASGCVTGWRPLERIMQLEEIRLDEDLPAWARAIGAQLADDLIETHMTMPHAILMARYRLETSERLGPRRRLKYRRDLH
jgi:hypothetical protein